MEGCCSTIELHPRICYRPAQGARPPGLHGLPFPIARKDHTAPTRQAIEQLCLFLIVLDCALGVQRAPHGIPDVSHGRHPAGSEIVLSLLLADAV